MATPQAGERSLWYNRDFLLLTSGQVVSFVGDQAQILALPLVVLAVTGSATQAGLVTGVSYLSFLFFGLVAGAVADRWNRKFTMIWCEVARALLTASVVVALWLGSVSMLQLYAVAALTGALTTLFQAANTAALPNVVDPRQLSTALGHTQAAVNTVRVFGATLAGVLYALGRSIPFAVNAVSFLVSAATLRFVNAQFQEKTTGRSDAETAEPKRKLTADIREGLAWVWGQPVIRFLTIIQAADSLRYGAGYLIIIVLAQEVGASATQIGFVFTGAAVGAVLGALVSGRAARRFPLGRIAIVMLWAEALMFPLYAIAPNWLMLACVALAESVVAPVYSVAMTTYLMSITPDALRGRTASAESTLTTGAQSLGNIVGGALIAALGAVNMVLLCGVWLLGLAVATSANKAIRTAPKQGDADGPTAPETEAAQEPAAP
ncbi:MFS transporter [Streptomyces sp. NPDC004270]